jgi:hypothetical protein
MNHLTRKELAIVCLLLSAVVTGGIVRLCRKGWTASQSQTSMKQPAPATSSAPPATP